jgi:hypothetical protein
MSWFLLVAALGALGLGAAIKWLLLRRWCRYYGNPKNLVFPKVCPVCMKPADMLVEEDSKKRTTANYVVVRQIEWWTAKIPHCAKCQRTQVRDLIIGLVLGGSCAIAIFLFTPAPAEPAEIIFYACFAYPFYVVADNLRKGVSFGWANDRALNMRIRRPDYYDRFLALNQSPAARDVPLAGGKGVWHH